MRKYIRNISFIAALAVMASLTACAGNSGSTVQDSIQSVAQEQSEPQQESAAEENSASQEEPQTSEPEQAQTGEAAVESGETADLQAIYDKIIAAVGDSDLVMLPESDPMIVDSYYSGLSELKLRQQLLYMAPVTGFACEVMLVEAEDSENADNAEEIFRGRIELGASEDFYPETAAAWQQNAQVQRSGNLVCMIALPEGCSIPDDVFAL